MSFDTSFDHCFIGDQMKPGAAAQESKLQNSYFIDFLIECLQFTISEPSSSRSWTGFYSLDL